MTKIKSSVGRPAPDGGLIQTRQNADQHYMGNQESSNSWKPLLASIPVGFMELRPGMCRWPIGDPHDFDTIPVLRLCLLAGCHLLRDAQKAGVSSEPV